MSGHEMLFYQSIVRGMSEGVLTLNMTGRITTLNAAAKSILALGDEIVGEAFGKVFFRYTENDGFNQAVLDAVYENAESHNVVADYFDGEKTKRLFINTSYLKSDTEKIGVSIVFSDISELVELQNAVKAMNRIRALNEQLERRNEFIKKTFGRYLSDDIVEQLLETDDGLVIGGQKQIETIMFSDLRGFTAISEMMNPTDLIQMLNYYLSRMIDIIQRHRGTILEFIGDAIVTVFGAPVESAQSEADAVACAIEMQRDMAHVNAYNLEHHFHELEMGIGIHTGEVILGNIGSDKKTKYDVIGKNVNLASRIETYTVGGQILISPVTRSIIGSRLKTASEQQILPKGVKTPITIYEVASLDGVAMPDSAQHFRPMEPPAEMVLHRINGKSAETEGFAARICEISEKEALLQTDAPVQVNENIVFTLPCGDVYAKVKETGAQVRIHITMGRIS